MMVPAYKKSHLYIIVASVILVVGIVCTILAVGITNHWDMDWSVFGSDWAIILYIAIGVYLLFVGWLLVSEKIKKL